MREYVADRGIRRQWSCLVALGSIVATGCSSSTRQAHLRRLMYGHYRRFSYRALLSTMMVRPFLASPY